MPGEEDAIIGGLERKAASVVFVRDLLPQLFFCIFWLAIFQSLPAVALPPASETGACSLEGAAPATVAAVDDDLDLLLDDGRRATLSGLEFPPSDGEPQSREAAHRRLSDWLVGRDIFIGALAAAPDRWGRASARAFAAEGEGRDAPLISVAAALLSAGDARFRPEPGAAPCAKDYLAAEAAAREAGRGLWSRPEFRVIDPAAPGAREDLLGRKGMVVVAGAIRSVGETDRAIYLNFGQKRRDDFSVVISRRNLTMFEGIELRSLIGRRARVRGLVETGFGPRIEIATPAEIEFFDGGASP